MAGGGANAIHLQVHDLNMEAAAGVFQFANLCCDIDINFETPIYCLGGWTSALINITWTFEQFDSRITLGSRISAVWKQNPNYPKKTGMGQ